MKDILETVPSSTTPGKEYHIIRGKDGKIYCDCPGWIFKARKGDGKCKHIIAYMKKGFQVVVMDIEEFLSVKRASLMLDDVDVKNKVKVHRPKI